MQQAITQEQIERTRAREVGMVRPSIIKPEPKAKPEPRTELAVVFPLDRSDVPRLVISIPLPWGRLYRLWGRIGHHLRAAYPDVCGLAREARKGAR